MNQLVVFIPIVLVVVAIILVCVYTINDPYAIPKLVATTTTPLYRYTSLIGNEPLYEDSLLPESRMLTKNWKVFRDEALATYKTYSSIKGDMFFEDIVDTKEEWKKLYIKWHSKIDPIARKKCPKSCAIIEKLPNVKVAMFSVLAPGAKIHPHKGPYKGCIRYHLGLATPNSSDCFISVDNKIYSWKDGEGILLDDTFEHWVANNTDQTRIILFADIVRPMSFVGKHINAFIMNNIASITSREN